MADRDHTVVLCLTLPVRQCTPQPSILLYSESSSDFLSSLLQSKSQNSKDGVTQQSPISYYFPLLNFILASLASLYFLHKKYVQGIWLCGSLKLESFSPDISMTCFLTYFRCLLKIYLGRPSMTTLYKNSNTPILPLYSWQYFTL